MIYYTHYVITSILFKQLRKFEEPVPVEEFSRSNLLFFFVSVVPNEVTIGNHGNNYREESKQTSPRVRLKSFELGDFHWYKLLVSRVKLKPDKLQLK